MAGEKHPGRGQSLQSPAKGNCGDDHRGDAGFFQKAGEVSDGHVADRSDRHQQHCVYLLLLEHFDPLWRSSFEQP